MKFREIQALFTLLVAVALSSCSGPLKSPGGGGGGGGGGNAILNVTVTASPSTKFAVVWLSVPVDLVSVTSTAGGQPISIVNNTNLITQAPSEINRLQTDSNYIGKAQVSAGTYKNVLIAFSTVTGVYLNSSAATSGGCPLSAGTCPSGSASCPANSFCLIPEVPALTQVLTVPFNFTVAGGTNMGLDINLNMDAAMTTKNGLTIDFTQPNAFGISLLPRKGITGAGTIDTLEDYTGTVTAISGNQLTVQSDIEEARTFTLESNTAFDDPLTSCTGTVDKTCLGVNQNVSVDASAQSDGLTFPASEVDFLDKATLTHEIEGIVLSTNTGVPNQFKLLITNVYGGDINNTIILHFGEIINVNIQAGATFLIDSKRFGNIVPTAGFQSQTDLFSGQEVMVHGLTQSNTSPIAITTDRVVLRYSHLNGLVGTVSGNNFTMTNVSSLFGPFLVSPTVETVAGTTIFDNATATTDLVNGNSVSIRTLYFNPTTTTPFFLAAKVRAH